jgi:lysophospholipase L1-like esterase
MARKQKADKVNVEKLDKAMRAGTAGTAEMVWHCPKTAPLELAGFAWLKTDGAYRRLPLKPADKLPEAVDSLANSTAGGQIRFQTDSRRLSVRVKLLGLAGMNHMPATGQCGFDCYIGPPGQQRYCNTTKYDHKLISYECLLFELPESELRNITLYFPLYQGVEEVSVGLDAGSKIASPPPFRLKQPVIVYGTSITQGGCAARPGMAFTNILSRRLNAEFINLGFSGNGRGEPELARTIAGIADPACLVLDYEANAGTDGLRKTLGEFIRILRAAHPKTPILVIGRPRFANENFKPAELQGRLERRDFQKQTVADLRKAGDALIWFEDYVSSLPAAYDEGTVDGVHPTDLGFQLIADGLEPILKRLLF